MQDDVEEEVGANGPLAAPAARGSRSGRRRQWRPFPLGEPVQGGGPDRDEEFLTGATVSTKALTDAIFDAWEVKSVDNATLGKVWKMAEGLAHLFNQIPVAERSVVWRLQVLEARQQRPEPARPSGAGPADP